MSDFSFDAGAANRRAKFEKLVTPETLNSYGEVVPAWETVRTVWASKTEVPLWASAEVRDTPLTQLRRPARLVTRYFADIDSTMRVTISGRRYQILSLTELGKREALEMMIEEFSTDASDG